MSSTNQRDAFQDDTTGSVGDPSQVTLPDSGETLQHLVQPSFEDTGDIYRWVDILEERPDAVQPEYYNIMRGILDNISILERRVDEQDTILSQNLSQLHDVRNEISQIESHLTELDNTTSQIESSLDIMEQRTRPNYVSQIASKEVNSRVVEPVLFGFGGMGLVLSVLLLTLGMVIPALVFLTLPIAIGYAFWEKRTNESV